MCVIGFPPNRPDAILNLNTRRSFRFLQHDKAVDGMFWCLLIKNSGNFYLIFLFFSISSTRRFNARSTLVSLFFFKSCLPSLFGPSLATKRHLDRRSGVPIVTPHRCQKTQLRKVIRGAPDSDENMNPFSSSTSPLFRSAGKRKLHLQQAVT